MKRHPHSIRDCTVSFSIRTIEIVGPEQPLGRKGPFFFTYSRLANSGTVMRERRDVRFM